MFRQAYRRRIGRCRPFWLSMVFVYVCTYSGVYVSEYLAERDSSPGCRRFSEGNSGPCLIEYVLHAPGSPLTVAEHSPNHVLPGLLTCPF